MKKAKLYTTKQVEDEFNLPAEKQRELIRAGKLKAINVSLGRRARYMISAESLNSLFEELAVSNG